MVILIWLIFTVFISCITLYYDYNTKIISLNIKNGEQRENLIYGINNNHNIDKQAHYCILIHCAFSDSLIKTERNRNTAMLENATLINFLYGAYDPGHVDTYYFTDSVVSLNISSLYDFNDSIKEGLSINNLFEIFYADNNWNNPDTIKNISTSATFNFPAFINNRVRFKQAHFKLNPDFILKLATNPDFKKQQFVLTLKLRSNKTLCDTTEIVHFASK